MQQKQLHYQNTNNNGVNMLCILMYCEHTVQYLRYKANNHTVGATYILHDEAGNMCNNILAGNIIIFYIYIYI